MRFSRRRDDRKPSVFSSAAATAFVISALLAAATGAHAADLIGSGPGFDGFGIHNSLSYSGILLPQNSGGASDLLENRLRGTFLLSEDGADSLGLQAKGSVLYFGAPPVLQNSGVAVENTFYDLEAGLRWRHTYEDHHEITLSGSAGSASDEPFHGLAETVFQLNGAYILPTDRNHSWLFLIAWSNNRPFLNYVPLPGAVYSLSSEDQKFRLSVGFPFDRLSYEFADTWTIKASFVGVSQASAELNKALCRIWQLYLSYDWGQRSWLRVARIDPLDRLFYDEQRTMLGVRAELTPMLVGDLSGGYAFGRRLFEAHSYYAAPSGASSLSAGWEFQFALGLKGP